MTSGKPTRPPQAVSLIMVLLLSIGLLASACRSSEPTAEPTSVALPATPAELPSPGVADLAATTSPDEEAVGATATAVSQARAETPTASPSATSAAAPDSATGDAAAAPAAVGQPNRIVIPKIALDAPIVDVGWQVVERGDERFTEWQTADNAAGRHINSAQPGEQGNVVLSGHHNTKGEVFRRVSELELEPGDLIYLYDEQGRRYTYAVDEVTDPPLLEVGATTEQRLANARYIQPTNDARVTLVTCWPYWTNTHRVVVVAKMVDGS